MSKLPKSKPSRGAPADATTPKPSSQTNVHSVYHKPASRSKQARVVAMLQSPNGSTIEAMMQATNWQQHSVRGFLAGVVRKKLKLKLSSTKIDGRRIYRIDQKSGAKAGGKSAKRRTA